MKLAFELAGSISRLLSPVGVGIIQSTEKKMEESGIYFCPSPTPAFFHLIPYFLILNWDLYHQVSWFSDIWTWTELPYQLCCASSLQIADCGTSQPS